MGKTSRVIPLILVELYLIITLILFLFGPIDFKIYNYLAFLILILVYHLSFVFGYVLSNYVYKLPQELHFFSKTFSNFGFFVLFSFGVLSCLVTYKNVMLTTSLIPYSLFQDVKTGLESPVDVYVDRLEAINSGQGNTSRVMNVLSIFFMFFKFLFIFYSIYFWRDLNFIYRIVFFLFCGLFIAPSLAGGINSILFYFFIFSLVSLFTIKFIRGEFKPIKTFFLVFLFLLIPIGFFGYIMSLRGGGFDYFNSLSPVGDISISFMTPDLESFLGFYTYALVWLNSYIVQGYYGFSLALGEDWIWTYGFGSSHFFQNQYLVLFGSDISGSTFQSRISDFWDEKAMWHSFYAQIANDVGFLGVSIVMFILGFLLSRVWLSVIYENSFYGAAMLPILVILFIFIPANNQVFGFIDTTSYFFAIFILWFFEGKKITFKKN